MAKHASVLCICMVLTVCLARRPVLRRPRDSDKTGSYIVVLRQDTSHADMQSMVVRVARLSQDSRVHACVETVAKSFTAKLSPYALESVRRMPEVDYCEEEGFAFGTTGLVAEWHVDRIDQCEDCLPLDLQYNPIGDGHGADVYILDSGIAYDHKEFQLRAKYAGYDAMDEYEVSLDEDYERREGRDCHGHGTHVASLCGGATFGVARKVRLYSVRILNCGNSAPWSVVLDGMDYVLRTAYETGRPSIMSMSIGGDHHRAVNEAVATVVNHGIHVVVAAGNGLVDSCLRSPASAPEAISVAGSREGDGVYTVGSGTNYGACVDIFAPGEDVLAADYRCSNCSRHLSGTSMATPKVSGVLAIMLTRQPLLSPLEIKEKLLGNSLKDVLDFSGIPDVAWPLTPNRLLNIQGGCGGDVLHSTGVITSANYLREYPGNLDCEWLITGDVGQQVAVTVEFVHLEELYDTLSLYDGYCYDPSSLVHTFTGIIGASFHYRSEGQVLCVKFVTDCTGSGIGFNITYSKVYTGTDLQVPEPDDFPTAAPVIPRKTADIQSYFHLPAKSARATLNDIAEIGYKPCWITVYRVGLSKKAYFDLIFTNSSLVNKLGVVDVQLSKFNDTLSDFAARGYSITHLTSRARGRTPTEPSFSAVFSQTPDILDTKVYLADTVSGYLARLADKRANGYQLVSHSFCEIQGTVQVASVYTIDKRRMFNISFAAPALWESFHNLTFLEFTTTALQMSVDNYFPSSLEVNCYHGNSYVAVIFVQLTTNDNWFRWGLNVAALRNSVRDEARSWVPRLTVGYDYIAEVSHYLQFQRKSLY